MNGTSREISLGGFDDTHQLSDSTLEIWRNISRYANICECLCNSVMIPSGHMTSILPSILERGPPLLLSWRLIHFPPLKGFFLWILGSFSLSDVRSKVRDDVCVETVKPICNLGFEAIQNILNWTSPSCLISFIQLQNKSTMETLRKRM